MKNKSLFISLGSALAVACVVVILVVTGVFDGLKSDTLLGSVGVNDLVVTSMGDGVQSGYGLPNFKSSSEALDTRLVDIFAKKENATKVNRLALNGGQSYISVLEFLTEIDTLPIVCAATRTMSQTDQDKYYNQLNTINTNGGDYADNKYTRAIKESDVVIFSANDIVEGILNCIFEITDTKSSKGLYNKLLGCWSTTNGKGEDKFIFYGELLKIDGMIHSDKYYAKLDKVMENYKRNFSAVITAINKINPDCTILVLNNYNPYSGFIYEYRGATTNLEDISTNYINKANEYLANCSLKDLYTIVDIKDLNRSMTNMSVKVDEGKVYIDHNPNKEGHKYIADKLSEVYDAIKNGNAE